MAIIIPAIQARHNVILAIRDSELQQAYQKIEQCSNDGKHAASYRINGSLDDDTKNSIAVQLTLEGFNAKVDNGVLFVDWIHPKPDTKAARIWNNTEAAVVEIVNENVDMINNAITEAIGLRYFDAVYYASYDTKHLIQKMVKPFIDAGYKVEVDNTDNRIAIRW